MKKKEHLAAASHREVRISWLVFSFSEREIPSSFTGGRERSGSSMFSGVGGGKGRNFFFPPGFVGAFFSSSSKKIHLKMVTEPSKKVVIATKV